MRETLVDQIADLLADRALLITALVGDLGVGGRLAGASRAAAQRIVECEPAEQAGLVGDLVTLEWGHGDPADWWWQTPLGQLATLTGDPTGRLTNAQAATRLGVSRQRVHELTTQGRLDGHPDGGVTARSVIDRLAQQR